MKPLNKLHVFRLALALLAVILGPIAMAQTSSVELLGVVTAAQASNGLGFNLDGNNEWEWAAAATAGAKFARIQCSWSIVEQQTAPPNNTAADTQYVQDPQCVNAFSYAIKYGISPIVVAAYGPPYHKILGVTVPQGAAAGSKSFIIEFQEGIGGDTLASLAIPYDYFCPASTSTLVQTPALVCASEVTASHSPEGSLIQSVTQTDSTHATITLASALTVALPVDNSLYNISEILYPSTATERATDPSVTAYANYVSFLANDLAARGVKGQIELWNEPPWASDPWDNRCLLYDADSTAPCPSVPGSAPSRNSPNYGFVANLQQRTMPEGITLTWNGTAGSGWASILSPRMYAESGVSAQTSSPVTQESFHPYGFEPEEMMWTTACLQDTASAVSSQASKAAQNLNNCYLPGEPTTSNYLWAVQADMVAKLSNPASGVGHEITETGILAPIAGLEVPQARFIMRQFLGFQADGISPVNFFKLFDSGALTDPNFSFIEEAGSTASYTAKPAFTAISGFMADINPINNPPVVAYSAQTLPSVVSYSGTFPLTSAHMVGARSGASANSDAFTVWQRSFVPCDAANVCGVWITQASPAAAPVTISIPAEMKVTQIVNVTTREVVSYTTAGANVSFMVADDPIEVLVDPLTSDAVSGVLQPTRLSLATSNAATTFGQQVILTATVRPTTVGTHSTDGQSVVFLSGAKALGAGTLSSGTATLAVTSIPAGTKTIVADYAGDSHFEASTGYTPISVANANPTLSIPTIGDQTYGVAPFRVTPSTNSTGAVSLYVVSGPASISGGSSTGGNVVVSGIGTVVLGAVQVPAANYNAGAEVRTSFEVKAADPGLAFQNVTSITYGYAPFPIGAKSASHGAVTYSVLSGPATVSGSTLTLTGAGRVVIEASQAANGSYSAATATLTFPVAKATPTLTMKGISSQAFNSTPIALSATSASSGLVTYAIASGPATVAGNMVTLTGAGTVVVSASQDAAGNYAAAPMVKTSFVVSAGKTALTFESIAPKSYGDAPFAIRATSASSGFITYTVVKGPAIISGSTITLTGAGTVGIQAVQAAAGNYTSLTASANFTVAKINPTFSIPSIAQHTYGDAPFRVAPSTNSTGAVSLYVVSGPASISSGSSTGGDVVMSGIGTVVLGATQVPTTNYNAGAEVRTSFEVKAADPGLVFQNVPPVTYGKAPFPVGAKSASHGPVAYSVVSGPATLSSSTVTLTGAGTVVIQANQAANGSYSAATATLTLTAARATPTLTMKGISSQTFSPTPIALSATSASSGAVTYTIVSGPATVSGNMITLTGAGTVVVGASQEAAGNYAATSMVKNSFVVSAGKTALTFDTITPKSYGDEPFSIKATSASTGFITYTVVKGPAIISGSTITLTGAGTVGIQAVQAAAGNYTSLTASVNFTVAKINPTLSIPSISKHTYGDAPFKVTPLSDSPGAVSLVVVSGPAHIVTGTSTGGTVQLLGTGTVVLGVTQVPTANYNAGAMVTTSFVVSAATPTLVLNNISTKKYGNATFPIGAKSASHGAVTYAVLSGPATVSGSTITITGAGTVVLKASQAANGNYLAASTTGNFTVTE